MSVAAAVEPVDDATAVVAAPNEAPAEGGEEPLTREQRLAMAMELKGNCDSLTALLHRLTEEERSLKEATAEFIIRDCEEENQRVALAGRVADAQRECLTNTGYVKWAQRHGVGEFDPRHRDGSGEEDGAARRPPPSPAGAAEAEPWTVGLPAGVPVPPVVVPLTTDSGLVAELKQWRAKANADKGDALLALLASRRPHGTVACVNGVPCLEAPDVATPSAALLTEASAAVIRATRAAPAAAIDANCVELVFAAWKKWLVARAAAAADAGGVTAVRAALTGAAAQAALRDDGSDVVAFVPAATLSDAVLCRAFVFDGTLKAVEVLPTDVDAAAPLALPPAALLAAVRRAVDAAGFPAAAAGARPKHHVVTVAVPHRRPGDAAVAPLLLHVEPLGPSVQPHHFTWGDLCSVARADASSGGGDGGGGLAFRYVRGAAQRFVAPAGDALAAAWADTLNACVRRVRNPTLVDRAGGPAAAAALAVAGLAAVAAVGAAFHRRR